MHFGTICDNGPSHVMASCAIGHALERRGHRFTLFGFPHLADWAGKEGISCRYLPNSHVISDQMHDSAMKTLSPNESIRRTVAQTQFLLRELPPLIDGESVDAMIVDATIHAAPSIAESFGIPYVSFHNALYQHEDPGVPPPISLPWKHSRSVVGRFRNRALFASINFLARPIVQEINRFRSSRNLPPAKRLIDLFSPLAQITQLVEEFDFPASSLSPVFHYVGPYTRGSRSEVPFPYEKLSGRPVVYAALGTIAGTHAGLWDSIAQACASLDVQLVIALGTRDPSKTFTGLPGDPIVVPYAPQQALLKRAALFITHAGLNSALEGLANGVPMLAIPLLWDQTAVAERIAYHRVGESLGPRDRKCEAIRNTAKRILANTAFRDRCHAMSTVVQASKGADRAAEIIEQAAITRKPVLRVKQ